MRLNLIAAAVLVFAMWGLLACWFNRPRPIIDFFEGWRERRQQREEQDSSDDRRWRFRDRFRGSDEKGIET